MPKLTGALTRKQTASTLAQSMGFEVVDAGDLKNARSIAYASDPSRAKNFPTTSSTPGAMRTLDA